MANTTPELFQPLLVLLFLLLLTDNMCARGLSFLCVHRFQKHPVVGLAGRRLAKHLLSFEFRYRHGSSQLSIANTKKS